MENMQATCDEFEEHAYTAKKKLMIGFICNCSNYLPNHNNISSKKLFVHVLLGNR